MNYKTSYLNKFIVIFIFIFSLNVMSESISLDGVISPDEWNDASIFNLEYEVNKDAFKILDNYYPKGEFNESRQRMAMMPNGSELIFNPMTAAPGFKINNVYVLPGVPEIMQIMFLELIKKLKKGEPKLVVTINTNLYESKIAYFLKDIQNKYKDSSIGSYPYFNLAAKTGGVNIVVSSAGDNLFTYESPALSDQPTTLSLSQKT